MPKDGRQYRTQQTHYLRKTIRFDSAPSGTQIPIGTLPQGALVTSTIVAVSEAFNAATSNALIVGTAADDDALVDVNGVNEGAIGSTRVAPATLAGLIAPGTDTTVFAKYSQTGTAATAGRATILVEFAVDNDG
jgi:hypothetical protein